MSGEIYEKTIDNMLAETTGVNGLGGTLTGNALALAAMRATLETVATTKAYHRMLPLAEKFNEGVQHTIRDYELPWHSVRLGARVEYRFGRIPPRCGGDAIAAKDPLLNKYMHLYDLNRGILLTPFHNMALMSPYSTRIDVGLHTNIFRDSVEEIAN